MKNLTIINQNGQLLIDSREVAEMVSVRHADLLEKIDGYIKHLTNGNFRSLDYFIGSTYKDGKGESRPCYLLTRKGCDMVANKLTGEKGVWFTAEYVAKFEEMERAIQQPFTGLSPEVQAIFFLDKKAQEIEIRVERLENNKTIDYGQQLVLQNAARQRVVEVLGSKDGQAYQNSSLRGKVFSSIWRDFKGYFNVDSYRNTRVLDLEKAREYIKDWRPQGKLLREIEVANSQLAFS
ncbi:ORF6C domain-containing protein [Brevibacillus sp. NPDC058079]|uniref:ORF6C domain-containing protein n=1 Tax=Brevibacillus sp. NPDC058079 TaxID=3346330 RepID=UPI0036EBB06A